MIRIPPTHSPEFHACPPIAPCMNAAADIENCPGPPADGDGWLLAIETSLVDRNQSGSVALAPAGQESAAAGLPARGSVGPNRESPSRDDFPAVRLRRLEGRGVAARQLLPAVRALLKDVGASPGQLQQVLVSVGPGSFTGLRLGLTTAKSLAYALGIQVSGYLSLDLVAWNACQSMAGAADPSLDSERLRLEPDIQPIEVRAVTDAQRGQLFLKSYGFDGSRLTRAKSMDAPNEPPEEFSQTECRIVDPAALWGHLDGRRRWVVGVPAALAHVAAAAGQQLALGEAQPGEDPGRGWLVEPANGISAIGKLFSSEAVPDDSQPHCPVLVARPSAADLVRLHISGDLRPVCEDLWALEPIYVRPSAAEEKAAGDRHAAGNS